MSGRIHVDPVRRSTGYGYEHCDSWSRWLVSENAVYVS